MWWGYSTGGHGLYAADIGSYQQWEIDEVSHLLTPTTPHIAVLSGRFDTTAPRRFQNTRGCDSELVVRRDARLGPLPSRREPRTVRWLP